MSDTVFRTKIDAVQAKPIVAGNNSLPSVTHEEVPYSSYSQEHGHSYLVDHYKLGDSWEVFNDEVGAIEGYIRSKIDSGELPNSQSAVKKEISNMEKMNNLKDEERTVVKLGVLSSYIKFLLSKDEIKRNSIKYGNT